MSSRAAWPAYVHTHVHLCTPQVPLVRCVDELAGRVACDVVPSNVSGVQNSKLLACYTSSQPAFKQLAMLVKMWAKRRGLNNAMKGGLSSYEP